MLVIVFYDVLCFVGHCIARTVGWQGTMWTMCKIKIESPLAETLQVIGLTSSNIFGKTQLTFLCDSKRCFAFQGSARTEVVRIEVGTKGEATRGPVDTWETVLAPPRAVAPTIRVAANMGIREPTLVVEVFPNLKTSTSLQGRNAAGSTHHQGQLLKRIWSRTVHCRQGSNTMITRVAQAGVALIIAATKVAVEVKEEGLAEHFLEEGGVATGDRYLKCLLGSVLMRA